MHLNNVMINALLQVILFYYLRKTFDKHSNQKRLFYAVFF